MALIKSFSIYRAQSKLEKPIADSTHTLTEISFIVLRLEVEGGIMGESYLLSFQYSPDAIIGALKDVGQMVVGEQVEDTQKVWQKIDRENEYFGNDGINRWAQAAYNIAMWDAWGKKLNQPVWKLLGVFRAEVPVYGSGGWISYSIEELKEEVMSYKKRGFQAVKIKVGKPDWKEDVERLRVVREHVGPTIQIMMDANQGMDVPAASALALEVKDLNIHWFEEPIDHTDYEGFQALRSRSGVSIAMGEREYSFQSLKALIRRNAIDIWQPDILRIGGVERWRASAALADAYNISVLPHYYKEYDVPLLCTIPNGKGAEWFDWVNPLIDYPLKVENGKVRPLDKPGWGFSFNDSVLNLVN